MGVGRDLMIDGAQTDPTNVIRHNGSVLAVDMPGRAFKRRAIKGAGSGSAREVCWLVGELDGVRAYVMEDGRVILTRDDLSP
jgi:hypothetical protein